MNEEFFANNQYLLERARECIVNRIPMLLYGLSNKNEILKGIVSKGCFFDSVEITDFRWLTGLFTIDKFDIVYKEGILIEHMKKGSTLIFNDIHKNVNLLDIIRPILVERCLYNGLNQKIEASENFHIIFTADNNMQIDSVYSLGPWIYDFKKIFLSYTEAQLKVLEYDEDLRFYIEKINNDEDIDINKDNICNRILQLRKHFPKEFQSIASRISAYECLKIFSGKENPKLQDKLYLTAYSARIPENFLTMTSTLQDVLTSLLFYIERNIPALLVGETGIGKTALLQSISRNSDFFFNQQTNLKIINMSSDFDISTLIGGYKTVDSKPLIETICRKYNIKHDKSKETMKKEFVNIKKQFELEGKIYEKDYEEIKTIINLFNTKLPFVYEEGILIEAMRKGCWVLLDEINLASTEILEVVDALARRKDVFVDHEGEVFNIHENFRIFACMNPAGDYGKKEVDLPGFQRLEIKDFTNNYSDIVKVIEKYNLREEEKISEFIFFFKEKVRKGEFTNILEPVVSGRTVCRIFENISRIYQSTGDFLQGLFQSFSIFLFSQLNFYSRLNAMKLFTDYFGEIPNLFEPTSVTKSLVANGYIVSEKLMLTVKDVIVAIEANIPVILQGNTCAGKTSLVFTLGEIYNRKVIRLNNHQHTDTSDYIGRYVNKEEGFIFEYGPLISAMRNGCWIILDELNLAPTDILEALNRLLDDNREIYVAETGETIRCHEDFRLFGTQNLKYGGRNELPKSFRNRFCEITFFEKTVAEIKAILMQTSSRPESFVDIMLEVYNGIRLYTNDETAITLRDLEKWTKREPYDYNTLFGHGYELLVLKQRTKEEKELIYQKLIEPFKKKKKLGVVYQDNFYSGIKETEDLVDRLHPEIVMTKSWLEMLFSVRQAVLQHEPVLLVGQTGIGKTKMCEVVAQILGKKFYSINLNENTDASDLIGHFEIVEGKVEWREGILLTAIKEEGVLLLDEINLAEDAVLERFNSLLESSKTLFVPELGQEFQAANLVILATMNPSGDFGKRELTPALRTRFTEFFFALSTEEKLKIVRGKETGEDYSKHFEEIIENISLRKACLTCDHISMVKKEFGRNCDEEIVWNDCLELLGMGNGSALNYLTKFDIHENQDVNFLFQANKKNFNRLLRGLLHQHKGILIEGSPGTGKSSTIIQLAKIFNKRCLRINLSDSTEISDLLGMFIPKGDTITFVASTFTEYLKTGNWIVLDEINLCRQSVIEGLNSCLDYRRQISLNNTVIKVHPDCRIFGTMNPCGTLGRKFMPRSFLDRFIYIRFDEYSADEVRNILRFYYGDLFCYDEKEKLRFNIIRNQMNIRKSYGCSPSTPSQTSGYTFSQNMFRINDLSICCKNKLSRTVPHSHVTVLYEVLKALINDIPVIITGAGKTSFLHLISQILSLEPVKIYCSHATDTSDLLGQFVKNDCSNEIFEWMDSLLVQSLQKSTLVVFNDPEKVDKSVFDRLNTLFEFERTLDIHERGFSSVLQVNPLCKLVLVCEDPSMLSGALLDRCFFAQLPDVYDNIDIMKMHGFHRLHSIDIFDTCHIEKYDKNELFFNLCTRNFSHTGAALENIVAESEIDDYVALFIPLESRKAVNMDIVRSYDNIFSFATPHAFSTVNNKVSTFIRSNCINRIYRCDDVFSLQNTIIWFIESMQRCALSNYDTCQSTCQILGSLEKIDCSDVEKTQCLYDDFNLLLSCEEDPIKHYLDYLDDERIKSMNNLKMLMRSEIKQVYKYGGESKLTNIREDLRSIEAKYSALVKKISVTRNWKKFKILCSQFSICQFLNEKSFSSKFCLFNDLIDFVILKSLNDRKVCQFCASMAIRDSDCRRYGDLAAKLINEGKFINLSQNNYVYYFFHRFVKGSGNSQDSSFLLSSELSDARNQLVFDSIVYSEVSSSEIQMRNTVCSSSYEFVLEDLKAALANIFPEKTVGRVIETRKRKVLVSAELVEKLKSVFVNFPVYEEIMQLSIFVSPTELLEILHAFNNSSYFYSRQSERNFYRKNLEIIESEMFCNPSVLTVDSNYCCLLFFLFDDIQNSDLVERFFIDSLLYEFYGRITLAIDFILYAVSNIDYLATINTCFQNKSSLALLYAYSCIYKALGIVEFVDEKEIQEKRNLRNNSTKFKTIIQEHRDKFLLQPTITVIENTSFSIPIKPECECHEIIGEDLHERFSVQIDGIEILGFQEMFSMFGKLVVSDKLCLCEKAKVISDNMKKYKRNILKAFSKSIENRNLFSEFNILQYFMNRNLDSVVMYSDFELNIARVVYLYHKNIQYMAVEKQLLVKCFFKFIVDNQIKCSKLLSLVFNFIMCVSNDSEETEGDGLKDGTGTRNIEDKIDGDDIENEYNHEDPEIREESQAQELSNDGALNDPQYQNDEEEEESENEEQPQIENGNEENSESESCEGFESVEQDLQTISNDSDTQSMAASVDESELGEESPEYLFRDLNRANNTDMCDDAINYSKRAENTEGGKGEDGLAAENNSNPEDKNALIEVDNEIKRLDTEDKEKEVVSVARRQAESIDYSEIDDNPEVISLVKLLLSLIENNKNRQYKGNYKNGKKLNMRAIVPYIASGFTKDRIWLRRTKKSGLDLAVRIFIDNSSSMLHENIPKKVIALYYKLKKAFDIIGNAIEVYKFGNELVNLTEELFSPNVCLLDFSDTMTDISFINDKKFSTGINILISDGIFNCNRKNNFGCLIIDAKNILKMNIISFYDGKMFSESYLNEFPLIYEIVDDDRYIEEKIIDLIRKLLNK